MRLLIKKNRVLISLNTDHIIIHDTDLISNIIDVLLIICLQVFEIPVSCEEDMKFEHAQTRWDG